MFSLPKLLPDPHHLPTHLHAQFFSLSFENSQLRNKQHPPPNNPRIEQNEQAERAKEKAHKTHSDTDTHTEIT